MRTKKLKLRQIGTCPHCGAPIYNENADGGLPKAAFTCECRFRTLPQVQPIIIQPPMTPPQPTWYWSVPYNPWPPVPFQVVSIGGGTIGPPAETITIIN